MPEGPQAALDAWQAAACLAVDPAGLGGALLRVDLHEVGSAWLEALAAALPAGEPLRRLPAHVDDERLLGGIDLAASLRAGRPVHARGLLEEHAGGVLVLPGAERAPAGLAMRLCALLDEGRVRVAREGRQREFAGPRALVALDGGRAADEACAPRLAERLALHLDLTGLPPPAGPPPPARAECAAARARLERLAADDAQLQALCAAALACGIDSVRAPLLALRVARAHAALEGKPALDEDDLGFAARVVLAPRATRDPAADADDAAEPPPPEAAQPDPPRDPGADADRNRSEADALAESVQEAARAVLPRDLLARLAALEAARVRARAEGRSGASQSARRRGRPAGVRAGKPAHGTRLNLLATLRAAAPWQRLRRAQAAGQGPRVRVLPDDFRVTWFRQRTRTLTLFAIDASGSSALHRLAEAKGAVELLLAECYVRRDEVAVLAFRGRGAELVLPPTRSLVRAKRSLAGLPGGGGTPLAAALGLAARQVAQARKRGQTPALVLLTDGQANVARDGTGGRERAWQEALAVARELRALAVGTLVVDTAPRPQPRARELATALAGSYLALPHADARGLAEAARHAR